MESLGLQESASINQDDNSQDENPDTKYSIEDAKYDSDAASSPELKRRRLMSDSSSSHTDDHTEIFGSPEPPIPMPVPDVKKEFDVTEGILMPTDPKEQSRRLSDSDKPETGTSEAAEFDADKGAGASEDAPKEEMSKEELAEEERRKMQVLVSSFSEEQLNRYEMYRRSSFPKAAIKRTDEHTGHSGMTCPVTHSVTHSSSQPETSYSQNSSVRESTQLSSGLSEPQTLPQHSIKQERGVPPPGSAARLSYTYPQQSVKQKQGVTPPGNAVRLSEVRTSPQQTIKQESCVTPPGSSVRLLDTQTHQQPIKQEPGVTPSDNATLNPNIALQQALSALQPLLGATHPTIGLQPTLGLPNLASVIQTQPLLPIQHPQLIPGLTQLQSLYQPTPSTTVFVLPQPNPVQAASETAHNHPQHKNCCPGCLADIRELKQLVDLTIRANTNPLIQTTMSNLNSLIQQQQLHQATSVLNPLIQQQQQTTSLLNPLIQHQQLNQASSALNPLIQQQQLHQATSALLQQQLQATSTLDTTIPVNNQGSQRLLQNQLVFNPVVSESSAQIPDSLTQPPSLASNARNVHNRTDTGYALNTDDRLMPTSTTVPPSSRQVDEFSHAGPSCHSSSRIDNSRNKETLLKSNRGRDTLMELIQSRLEPDPLNPSQYVVKDEVLYMLKQKSNDRQYIARRLANLLFTKQERRISNCHGRRHKRPLDPVRLDAIKRAVFKINPIFPDNDATRSAVWKQCCASIDMSSRSVCRNIHPEEV